ncbi:MAG TPA: Mur ligase family protein, partial [Planctomycetota bacterium]|nr:Mur ligase family protein [Planctomycetota bacterium]
MSMLAREEQGARDPLSPASLDAVSRWLKSRSARQFPRRHVSGVTCEVDAVRPGDLFVALQGCGEEVARLAMGRGAVAVVAEESCGVESELPVIRVPDAIRALGWLSAEILNRETTSLLTCGITGGFGKSSTIALLQAALTSGGIAATVVGGSLERAPAPHRFQQHLRNAWERSSRVCLVEAPTVDVARRRFEGTRFDVGVLTNALSRHLEVHGSEEERYESLLDVFRNIKTKGVAVLPGEDDFSEGIAAECRCRVLTYGVSGRYDVRGQIRRMDTKGTELFVTTPLGEGTLRLSLPGELHARNALAALATSLALSAPQQEALEGIASVGVLKGCLQALALPLPFSVYLDGADDAQSLRATLRSLGPLARRRVILVGAMAQCGDGARPAAMARVMEDLADQVIVTTTRSTLGHPMTPIRDLMRGFTRPTDVMLLPDRQAAVEAALRSARAGDIVLVMSDGDGESDARMIRDWCLRGLKEAAFQGE